MIRRALASCLAVALIGATPAISQTQNAPTLERGTVISPVLTIDFERVFRESEFGRRVQAEEDAREADLADENNTIATELEAEELALTEQRATLTPEAFRTLADAFHTKVEDTRAAQTAKGNAIKDETERAREVFLSAAVPVLQQLMRDAGAAVIIERRNVFFSASAIEITEDAIALLNDTLGSGAD